MTMIRGPARAICAACALLASLSAVCGAEETLTLDIETAYELCVSHSNDLKNSKFQLLSEQQKARLGAWSRVPSLDVNFSDSKTVRYDATDTSAVSVSTTLTVPVSRGGREAMQKKIDALKLDVQGVLLSKSEDDVKDACFQAFHQVRTYRMKLDALRELLLVSQNQCAIAEKEYELGKIREIDLIETSISLATLEQTIYGTETELLAAEYNLKKMIGIDQRVAVSIATETDETYEGMPIRGSVAELKNHALRSNTDLMKANASLEESLITNRVGKSSWNPNVDLVATVQLDGERYPLQNPDYGLKVNVNFPFDLIPLNLSIGFTTSPDMQYGRTYTSGASSPKSLDPIIDRRLSDVGLDQAIRQTKTAEDDILFQIDQLVSSYERTRREQQLLSRKLELQAKKCSVLALQLEIGKVTRVEYLEGENDLVNTRLDRLSGILSLLQAERQIERMAGLEPGDLRHFKDTAQ